MVLPLVQLPNPRLHQPSLVVDTRTIHSKEFQTMLVDMEETMIAANGVGIAGVQVGFCYQVFHAMHGKKLITVINPTLLSASSTKDGQEEGCLSVPKKYAPVDRATSVRMTGLNQRGLPIELKARGYFARVLQHEFDHLQGVLFVDRLS